jgi:hypothetical protein
MTQDFQSPPLKWRLLSQVGGVTIAGSLIGLLQLSDTHLKHYFEQSKTQESSIIANAFVNVSATQLQQWDQQSLNTPAEPPIDLAINPTLLPQGQLSPAERAMAQQAWQYFVNNWNDSTGLVNGHDRIAATSLDDITSSLTALVSAHELGLIPESEFKTKLTKTLTTLKTFPLYNDELPHRWYHSTTKQPLPKHPQTGESTSGWSAVSIGRLSRWFKIIATRYPAYEPQITAVWNRWQVELLTQNGHLQATQIKDDIEQRYQQGRLGEESYAAYGLHLWGLPVQRALQVEPNMVIRHVYGQPLPHDRRRPNFDNTVSDSSTPYILDGIETGFRALPQSYAEAILRVQMARFQKTQQLTAVAPDAIDRSPFTLQNTVLTHQTPWASQQGNQVHQDLRFVSSKAAIGWFVLSPSPYTKRLFELVQTELVQPESTQTKQPKAGGFPSGFYESLRKPNQALSADTNGIILASLLYRQVNQPLMDWAGIKPPKSPNSPEQ